MRIGSHHKSLLAAGMVAAALGAVPAEAMGAQRPEPFEAVATIASCRGQSLTIAARIEPASADAARTVRGAKLRLRFAAAPLFGRLRNKREIDLGRTASARMSERFTNLRAQSYSGIVRYRWVRGGRTVMSGLVRTSTAKAGGRRGKAFCSLNVGRRPIDRTPPVITPIPADSGWKRGPLTVNFLVFDDFSGVALVASRIVGGPFVRGRSTRIEGEGVHQLEYAARDAAGNQSQPATVTLRIDQNPPTAPAVTAPAGATSDSTPDIQWSASSDSASGVVGYVVLVRDSNGAIVWSQNVPASAPTAVTVGQALGQGSYTAEVVAYDGAAPEPFTATGTGGFSVVAASPSDPPPPPPPDADADGVTDASDNCPSTANSDQANFDGDGQGDACDADDDNDGLADPQDPNDNNADSDGDGFGDGTDPCPAQPESGIDLDPEGCP